MLRALSFTLTLCLLVTVVPARARRQQTKPPATSQSKEASADAGAELSRGKANLRRGRAAEALINLERALNLYKQAGNRSGVAAAHDLLGELYERQGQYEAAEGHFRSALEIFAGKAAQTDKAKDVASGVGAIAPVASTASKLVVNFDAYHASLMLSKIGNMLYRQGRMAEARQVFGQMQAQKPDTSGLGKAKGLGKMLGGIGIGTGSDNRGIAVSAPSIGTALTVKDRFEIYHRTIIYATQEIGLGRLDFRAGQLDSARKRFENALEATKGDLPFIGELGQARRFRTAARTGLGDVALSQGRFNDAAKLFQEAIKGAEKDKRLDLAWPAERGLARARWLQAAQEKDAKKADKLRQESLASYRAALKTIETIRAGSLRADEARTTFLATTADVFNEAVAAYAETSLANAKPDAPLEGKALEYASEAFRIAEQGRARSLLDLLAETNAQITEGVPAELLKRKRENLDKQSDVAGQLMGVSVTGEAPAEPVDKLEKELERLQTELDSIENEIRAASPRYAALVSPQPLALAEVQQNLLDDSTALLLYSLGAETSYLWAVAREKAALYKLPAREQIGKQVGSLRDQMLPPALRRSLAGAETDAASATTQAKGLPDAKAFADASHALYKSVYAPASVFVGERRVVVAADGALSYVPFEAFVTSADGGGDFASLPLLIKTNEIVYVPSATVLSAVRKQTGTSDDAARSVLLVADPVFDSSDARARGAQSATSGADSASRGLTLKSAVSDVANKPAKESDPVKLARLAGTRVEAQQVALLATASGMKADLWLDLEANEEKAATRDLKPYRIVHFATHGLLNTERPQFTGLVLSLVGNREEDGFLRTDEIYNLRLSRPLVMLSACETGLGSEKRGEGLIGLTRAFMYAGAPTVGVTLWSVADRSTAELMTDFYARLLAKGAGGGGGGASPVSALRAARLKMIEGKKYAAPFYWAPFVLVGDWR